MSARAVLSQAKAGVTGLVAGALHATGVLGLWLRWTFRNRAVVLMYHRVLTPGEAARTWSHPGIVVERDTFAKQMAAIRRYFRVLSPEEFVAHLAERRPFAEPCCLVTFDDGWLDNYVHAWPILQAHGVPALIFLPSAYIGTGRMFWQEQLKALLARAIAAARHDAALRDAAEARLTRDGLAALLDVPDDRVRPAVMTAVQARKDGGVTASATLIDDLEGLLSGRPEEPGPDAFMSWDMVREMMRGGVTFGAHGVTHRLMTELDLDAAKAEIDMARDAIAAEAGRPPSTFSYPNGNWNPAVAAAVREAGYAAAFTTAEHAVTETEDAVTVGRVNIHQDATPHVPLFLVRLCGAA